jgi:hypothetical protein
MKPSKYLTAYLAIAGICLASSAGAINLTTSDDYLFGSIVPGTPSNPANEAEMINFLVSHYTGQTGPVNLGDNPDDPQTETYTLLTSSTSVVPVPAPTATDDGSEKAQWDMTNHVIDLSGTSYDWLVAKYGQDSYVWHVAGLSEVTLPTFVDGSGGLSHRSLYNPGDTPPPPSVPDASTTLSLLGLALMGMEGVRRRTGRR